MNTVTASGFGETGAVAVVTGSVAVEVEPQPTAIPANAPKISSRTLISDQFWQGPVYPWLVSLIGVVLLAAAVALIVAAEWPRLGKRAGLDVSSRRERKRRKSHLRVVETETDDFARAVERDLANLPTIDPRERKKN